MELYDVKEAIKNGQKFFMFDCNVVKEIKFTTFTVIMSGRNDVEKRYSFNMNAIMANEHNGGSSFRMDSNNARPIYTSVEECCNDDRQGTVKTLKAMRDFVMTVMKEHGYEIGKDEDGADVPIGFIWNGRCAVPVRLFAMVDVLTHNVTLSQGYSTMVYKTAEECRNDNKPKVWYLK